MKSESLFRFKRISDNKVFYSNGLRWRGTSDKEEHLYLLTDIEGKEQIEVKMSDLRGNFIKIIH